MSIHYFELRLANYIQEKNGLSLAALAEYFEKSPSTLRRHLANINAYLPPEQQFVVEKECVANRLTYIDYIHFVSSLSLAEYQPPQKERLSLMLVYACFGLSLNMSAVAKALDLGLTTKKKDSKALAALLSKHHLTLEILSGKGVRIVGDESSYRILLVSTLTSLLEINADDNFSGRLANTPVEQMIFSYFIGVAADDIQSVKPMLREFLQKNALRLSYACKKFLYVYLTVALYRARHGFAIVASPQLPLCKTACDLLSDERENNLLSYIVASLDFHPQLPLPRDERLFSIASQLVAQVQDRIITRFHNLGEAQDEVYHFLYKSIVRNHLDYFFYDNKLDDTSKHLSNLFGILKETLPTVTAFYGKRFSDWQIGTLSLIFKRLINENKIIGRNSRKIVVVTNSSNEKINFFIGHLKQYFDLHLIDSIHINELHRLALYPHDALITFSNRISTLLEQDGYPCIKLNFYLTQNDINRLYSLGFSSSKRKIPVDRILDEVAGKTKAEAKTLLLSQYPDYFL